MLVEKSLNRVLLKHLQLKATIEHANHDYTKKLIYFGFGDKIFNCICLCALCICAPKWENYKRNVKLN